MEDLIIILASMVIGLGIMFLIENYINTNRKKRKGVNKNIDHIEFIGGRVTKMTRLHHSKLEIKPTPKSSSAISFAGFFKFKEEE